MTKDKLIHLAEEAALIAAVGGLTALGDWLTTANLGVWGPIISASVSAGLVALKRLMEQAPTE